MIPSAFLKMSLNCKNDAGVSLALSVTRSYIRADIGARSRVGMCVCAHKWNV